MTSSEIHKEQIIQWKLKNKILLKEYYKKYRKNNRERIKQTQIKWENNNIKKMRDYRKNYYIINRDKLREKSRIYRILNLENIRVYNKNYIINNLEKIKELSKKIYLKNRKKYLLNKKNHRISNPDYYKQLRIKNRIKIINYSRDRSKKMVGELRDNYIKDLLKRSCRSYKIKMKYLPSIMIETKREQLKLFRLIKNKNEN